MTPAAVLAGAAAYHLDHLILVLGVRATAGLDPSVPVRGSLNAAEAWGRAEAWMALAEGGDA